MKCQIERLIKALAGAELAKQRKRNESESEYSHTHAPLVISVSRGFGSNGKVVAKALGERLDLCVFDNTILSKIAERAHVDVELVKRLDENIKQGGFEPWRAFLQGESLSAKQYQRYLESVVLNLAYQGGIIVGRGANLILGPEKAFRLRIVGSLDKCAERVAKRDNIDLVTAKDRVRLIDRQRDEFIRKNFGVDINDNSFYDLVINSDRYQVPQLVELIICGLEQAGLKQQ